MREFVGGIFVELFVEEADLPVLEHIPGVQCHHVKARMRVARQEQYLVGIPTLRRQTLHYRGFELIRKRQHICGDQDELFVALCQHHCLCPNRIVNSNCRFALTFAVAAQGDLHRHGRRQVHAAHAGQQPGRVRR